MLWKYGSVFGKKKMSDKEFPLVSFVVPVYNGEEYIRDCLNSIENQDYPNIETIVVNDNSTDNTLQIVNEKFSEAVTISLPNKNYGHSIASNIGIESARGEYVGLLDDDVELPKTWVSQCIKSIDNQTDVAAVATKITNPDGLQWPSETSADSEFHVGTFVGCGVFFDKRKISETTYFPERYFVYGNEDKFAAEILNQGYRIKYDPSIETLHKDSTRGVFTKFRYLRKNRNMLWTAWTHDVLSEAAIFTVIHLAACFSTAMKEREPLLFVRLLISAVAGFKVSYDNRDVVTHPDWNIKK